MEWIANAEIHDHITATAVVAERQYPGQKIGAINALSTF
jgi:hypothetical protein